MGANSKQGRNYRAALDGLILVALLGIAPLFFIGGPDWASSPLVKAAWNLGHILFFGLAVALVRPRRWLQGWRLWLTVSVIVLGLGVAIELVQDAGSRELDSHDLLRNLIGAWAALAWQKPSAKPLGHWLLRGLTTLLVMAELGLVTEVAIQQVGIERQMPQLYDFSSHDPSDYWSGNAYASDRHVSGGEQSLALNLDPGAYSGVWLENLAWDWRGYESLSLTFHNPEQTPVRLTLRVNDVAHDRGDNAHYDRFNHTLTIRPGRHEFSFALQQIAQAPRDRTMDMARVRRLGLFASGLEESRTVYLLGLTLE